MKSLIEFLHDSQITEMARNLHSFKDLVSDMSSQIVQNWCLVKWCDLYPDNNISKRLRNHWCTELKSMMLKITNERLKSGGKQKVIKQEWINHLELNNPDEIANIIRNKFHKEGLSKYIYKISVECANSSDEITNVLSTDKYCVEEYLDSYIG